MLFKNATSSGIAKVCQSMIGKKQIPDLLSNRAQNQENIKGKEPYRVGPKGEKKMYKRHENSIYEEMQRQMTEPS